MRNRVTRYWPRLFGYALLLLIASSAGRSAPPQRGEKRPSQVVALQQRNAVLPQTCHNLTFRSAVLLAAGAPGVAGTTHVCHALETQAATDRLHSARSWRPDAPRPPPLTA